MNTPDMARWYVIHTYSGYEALVKDTIEKLIENNNLSDVIYDIKIPMEETIEEKNGKKKVVLRKIMPCYVFVKMVYSNDMWFLLTNTRGVTGFVGPQGKAIPLTDEEVRKIGLDRTVNDSLTYEIGEEVKIVNGPLASFLGTISSIDDVNKKAKVNVSMFGRDTEVEVEFFQLEKLRVE